MVRAPVGRLARQDVHTKVGLHQLSHDAVTVQHAQQPPLPVGFGQDSGDQVPRHHDIERAVAQRVAHAAPLRRKRGTRLWRTRLPTRSPVSTASSRSKSESRRSLRTLCYRSAQELASGREAEVGFPPPRLSASRRALALRPLTVQTQDRRNATVRRALHQ